eukprot:scaffold11323_cov111-Isochrysis_galbana.AAC.3
MEQNLEPNPQARPRRSPRYDRARPARASPRRHPLFLRLSATLLPMRQGYVYVSQPQEEEEDRQVAGAAGGRDCLPGHTRRADRRRPRAQAPQRHTSPSTRSGPHWPPSAVS